MRHPRSESWVATAFEPSPSPPEPSFRIGVLEGEGIGPEVVGASLALLRWIADRCGRTFRISTGGPIGRASLRACGRALSDQVLRFSAAILDEGGAILAGPGGGRFVYDLRRELDLFVKLNPIRPAPELLVRGPLRAGHVEGTDVLVVRDNAGGIYQGSWEDTEASGVRTATHAFGYTEPQVRRVLVAAARLARARSGRMLVVVKEAGVPAVSRLWSDCAAAVSTEGGVAVDVADLDYAAYRLLAAPRELDVIVSPNLAGDVLSDLGGILVGSRALCHGASFDARGRGVYQTNHGAAYDLAGSDRANPAGQMLALAALLRESFGMSREARWIEEALRLAWRRRFFTADLAGRDASPVGTREMTERVLEALETVAVESP